MEEDVYVIRLKRPADESNTSSEWSNGEGKALPSEERYSASFVLGLGSIHITLGTVSAVFAILALFLETEANQHAVGLWTGVLYVGCGVTGVLAYTRWYVRRQILVFLVTSLVSLMASIVSLAITSYGVHSRVTRLERRRAEHFVTPFVTNFNEKTEQLDAGAGTVTINLFVTTILELLLSILSLRVAFKGYRQREYIFSPAHNHRRYYSPPDLKSGKSGKRRRRREFILETDLPPGYAPGFLSSPDLLCHLTNPITNQYHVTRANPLCIENNNKNTSKELTPIKESEVENDEIKIPDGGGKNGDTEEEDLFSISTMSMDDKVQRFLAQAVQLAKQNSRSKVVYLEPSPIYGSVVA